MRFPAAPMNGLESGMNGTNKLRRADSQQLLLRAEDTLRKLWRAVEQSAEVVVITDLEGRIEYVNPAFEKLTGYSKQDATGKTPRILKSGEHSPSLYQELWQTVLAGNVYRGILANRKKNGEIYYIEKTITPVRDAEGRITHFISNDRNITEARRLQAELQQAQKMDAIGRLAGGVAHDFNNLLMVISAYAELSLDGLAGDDPQRARIEEILGASRRAADLTRQLLAFSRKQMQVLQVLDLNQIVQDVTRMLPRLIGEDIQLDLVPGKNLGKIKADPGQIEQILMNLAANARDAMPQGGTLTIETANVSLDQEYVQRHSIVPPGEYTMLAVTDSGEGIAPEHLAHIFEPFYTTKEEGKGTGLGLATVYGIAKQNGGFVWVYSEPGLGTTFKIYLPVISSRKTSSVRTQASERCEGGTETILLVEDESAVRRSAAEFLSQIGYRVLDAATGPDALRIAEEFPESIDLMITDVVMPLVSGAELAAQLTSVRPRTKVLFISGYAENTVLRHGKIDVNDAFLAKPFGLHALGSKVRRILDDWTVAASTGS
jgi:two-component system cell cycle sensor histidine kinase/response regulator CckA